MMRQALDAVCEGIVDLQQSAKLTTMFLCLLNIVHCKIYLLD